MDMAPTRILGKPSLKLELECIESYVGTLFSTFSKTHLHTPKNYSTDLKSMSRKILRKFLYGASMCEFMH